MTVLRKGDRLVIETAGGGGFGDPRLRTDAALLRDLADGKVSAAGAVAYGRRNQGTPADQQRAPVESVNSGG